MIIIIGTLVACALIVAGLLARPALDQRESTTPDPESVATTPATETIASAEEAPTTTTNVTETTAASTSAAATVTAEQPAPTITEPTPEPRGYRLEEVAQHREKTDCWTAVDGKVYDLTPFISKHPGGVKNIMKLCGIDGTAIFKDQHGSDSRAVSRLIDLYLGPLIER